MNRVIVDFAIQVHQSYVIGKGYQMSHGLILSHRLNAEHRYTTGWAVYDQFSGMRLNTASYAAKNSPAEDLRQANKRMRGGLFRKLAMARDKVTAAPVAEDFADYLTIAGKLKKYPYAPVRAERIPTNIAGLIGEIDVAVLGANDVEYSAYMRARTARENEVIPKSATREQAQAIRGAGAAKIAELCAGVGYVTFKLNGASYKILNCRANLLKFRKQVMSNKTAFGAHMDK